MDRWRLGTPLMARPVPIGLRNHFKSKLVTLSNTSHLSCRPPLCNSTDTVHSGFRFIVAVASVFLLLRTATSTTNQFFLPGFVFRRCNSSFSRNLEPKRMAGSARKDATDVESDRISSLPDDLIHKILSFMSVKDAIGTSVLSSRWRFMWTSMPHLNFENLNDGSRISKFISNVLSHRNNQIQLSSVNLVLGRRVVDHKSVTRILKCAFSHNVQELSVTQSFGLSSIKTPPCDLPALTTLDLHQIKLSGDFDSTGKCVGFFSKCINLKNLSLRRCILMKGTKVLNICLPRLSNLTLEFMRPDMKLEESVNVDAPQLKNLTIIRCAGKHLISAPGLTSLVIEGFHPRQISTPGFPSLEKADLYMYNIFDADAHKIVQHLHSAKLLILNLGILQRLFQQRKLLSSSMKLIPHQACMFANAKILKFTTKVPVKVYLEVQAQEKSTTSTELKNYKSSPSVVFPMVSDKEIKAIRDMASAQVFVEHLGLLLKQCRAITNNDNINAHLYEHGKTQVKKHWARELQLNLEEMMALITQSKFVASEFCVMWVQCMSSRRGTLEIIAWLQEIHSSFQSIKGWMTQLPESKRAVMQPNHSTLCEDAAIVTNNLLGWMKTRNETQETNVLII